MTKLIVMADYGCGLWVPNGCTSPEVFGAAPDLCSRFDDWLRDYCEYDNVPEGFDRPAYNERGRALAHEIKQLVGKNYYVVYRFLLPADNPEAELQWTEEEIL